MDLINAATPITIELPRDAGAVDGAGSEVWWYAGRLQGEGREIWIHHCTAHLRIPAPGVVGWTAIRDVTGGRYRHDTFMLAPGDASFASGHLDVHSAHATMRGADDLTELSLAATVPDASMALVMRPASPVLYGCGVGSYPFFETTTFQYSVAGIPTTGTVTIDGEVIPVTGEVWHDRQWWMTELPVTPLTWFGLSLDTGDHLSIFDTTPGGKAWVTAGHADGSHTVAAIAPLRGSAQGEARDPDSKLTLPQRWTVAIPALDAVLELEQALLHENDILYTGRMAVQGTYRGAPVTGYGFMDIAVGGLE